MQSLLQIPSSVVFIIILYAVVSLAASSFTSHGGEWGLISMVMAFDAGTAPLPCRTSSCITLDNVSQIYPVTLMNKLFSSVPKREYAIQNINLSFGHHIQSSADQTTIANDNDDGVILLVGQSASGKSTLLRLLAGLECPMNGFVSLNGSRFAGVGQMAGTSSWIDMGICTSGIQPVILKAKPDFDDTLSVIDRIVQVGLDDTICKCRVWKDDEFREEKDEEVATELCSTLAEDFASLLTLSDEQCSSVPSELSPSAEYLFGIACGCMISVAPSILSILQCKKEEDPVDIHYPILLLDELFDTEASSTVEKCSTGILNFIHAGGVVISATHRPTYFHSMVSRTVTLSGGQVLLDERRRIGINK